MFNKLKERLKNWLSKSKEEIEKKVEKIEDKKQKTKPKKISDALSKERKIKTKKGKEEKKEIKEEKKKPEIKQKPEILELEKEISQEIPRTEKEAEKEIKETQEKTEEIEKEIEKIEEQIEKAKKQETEKIPEEFNSGIQKYEPDLEKIREKKGFFSRIRATFVYKISESDFNDIFEGLELLFLENNVALEVVEDIRLKLSKKLIDKEIQKKDLETEIRTELKKTLNEILIEPDDPLDIIKEQKKTGKPFVILFFGINGTGKTTSIAKIASLLKKNNISVVLAAADTFRAASIEQIQIHADKLGVPLIKQDYNSDPSAVGFDAIRYAEKHKINTVLIDTAGRMHTKANLIAEMQKICRVTKPDLKIFVAESIAGNDATEQAKTFNQAIEIDGSILSKADIDEKGGTILSVSHATHKPIFYLGTGQEMGDLKLFNKQEFIESLGL